MACLQKINTNVAEKRNGFFDGLYYFSTFNLVLKLTIYQNDYLPKDPFEA